MRDEDARALRRRARGSSTSRRLAAPATARSDERPAVAEHLERLLDRRAAADDVEDEVEPGPRRCASRRSAAPARASARRGRSRGSRRRRRCRAPWIDGEPDRAAADHGDARALPDLRRLEHRHRRRSRRRSRSGTPARRAARPGSARPRPAWTTVRVANVPVRSTGDSIVAVARRSRRPRAGGVLQLARRAARAQRALAARRCASRARRGRPARRARRPAPTASTTPAPSWPSSTGQRMAPAVLLDDVQVGVADAARLDADEHLAGPRLVDARSPRARTRPGSVRTTPRSTIASSSRTTVRADERERQVGLGHQVADHRLDALLAADGEPVGVRPAEQHGVRAERERLDDVGAARGCRRP